jgi:hypothetical protein
MATRISALAVLAVFLAGCAGSSDVFSSTPAPSGTATATSSSGSVPIGDRISGFITGQSTSAQAPSDGPSGEPDDCPRLDIRQGASTLQIAAPGEDRQALAIQYQGVFVRAARECKARGTSLAMKIGVQGRIILGPAGAPGQVTVPLRYAIVRENLGQTTTVWTKLYTIPVVVPAGQPSVLFSHVESEVVLPIRPADVDDYVIYIGFDPEGAKTQPRRPPPRRAAGSQPSGQARF